MNKSALILDRVFHVTAGFYGLTVKEMMEGGNSPPFAEPRMVAMYLSMKLLPFENANGIGDKIGVSGSVIRNASKAINKRLSVDHKLKVVVEKLWETLKPTNPEWQLIPFGVTSNDQIRFSLSAAKPRHD